MTSSMNCPDLLIPNHRCRVSIIVPTYRERENIEFLVVRVSQALDSRFTWEMIISDDDSEDGTVELCEKLGKQYPVRLITRKQNRGLSPAVIDGISQCNGNYVIVMDADLSHPPETVPEMVRKLASLEADFVIGSRYVEGGGTEAKWSFLRRLNSSIATLLVYPLVKIKDPMSGFFAFRTDDLPELRLLNPIGYKIGLEILIKGHFKKTAEIPIHFSDRIRGKSKLSLIQQILYLRHLRRLYHFLHPQAMEIAQFIFVGAIGLFWDLLFYFVFQWMGASHMIARGLSFWPAVTSNWFLNRIMTFKERRHEGFATTQWLKFALVSAVGFLISWGTYVALTTQTVFFGNHRLTALLFGVALGTLFNFKLSDRVVYVRKSKDKP